jgi:hypothetical protein
MLNDCAPKIRIAKDEVTGDTWLASQQLELEPLSPSKTEYKAALPPKPNALKPGETFPEVPARAYAADFSCTVAYARSLAAVLVTHYLTAEDDCSWGNIGIARNHHGKIYTIDSGRALWPVTCKYYAYVPDLIYRSHYEVAPILAFPITKKDLVEFPLRQGSDAKPYNTINVSFATPEAKAKFGREKWKYFLKALLLDQAMFKKATDQFIDNEKEKSEILNYLADRWQTLKEVLLATPEFRQSMLNHFIAFKRELLQEFSDYNALKKPTDPVKFDLAAIEAAWKNLSHEVLAEAEDVRLDFIRKLISFIDTENASRDNGRKKREQLRSQKGPLEAALSQDVPQQINKVCRAIIALNEITQKTYSCNPFTPKSKAHWENFQTEHACHIQAFKDAYSPSANVYATTVGLSRHSSASGLPLLESVPA